MKKTVVILVLLTIISKILGFARDIFLSYFYGASVISDVFIVSMTIPTFIFAIIGKGISTGFIPLYTRIEKNEGYDKASIFTNNLINLVLVLCTTLICLGFLFTEQIVQIFASGFEGKELELTVKFTRITLMGIFFTGLIYVFSAYLQIQNVFIIPAIIGLPTNIILIASISLSSETNIYVLAYGSLFSMVTQFLLVCVYAYKKNYRYKPILDLRNSDVRKMIILAIPAILGTSVSQLNTLVDRTLASRIASGGITALNYANNLSLVIMGVFVLSITTILYPRISKLAAEDNMEGLKKHLSGAISIVNMLILPASVGFIFFSEPIIELLFGRGQFDNNALTMTSHALIYYSIGIIGLSQREVIANTFYSLQDTKTPMINAAIAMVINIILNFVLAKYMGIGGLALASSISAIICTILLFINLRKKLGSFGTKLLAISFLKILISSVFMGWIARYIFHLLVYEINQVLALCLSILTGITVYFFTIYFLKVQEINLFVYELKTKLKKIRVKEAS